MTGDGVTSYAWNGAGLLKTVGATTYTYDGDGKRVMNSAGTYYWTMASGNQLSDTPGAGTGNEYIFFAGQRIAWVDSSGTVRYYWGDHLGSTRVVTDDSGNVCYDADYYPFQGERAYVTTCAPAYRFAGMKFDQESGDYYTLNRYYPPNLGRWLSPDPLAGDITNPQSLNRYAYALNNPTNLIDPLGLFCYRGAGCPDDAGTVDYFNDFGPLADLINHAPSPGSSQEPGGPRHAGGGAGGGNNPVTVDDSGAPIPEPELPPCSALNLDTWGLFYDANFLAGDEIDAFFDQLPGETGQSWNGSTLANAFSGKGLNPGLGVGMINAENSLTGNSENPFNCPPGGGGPFSRSTACAVGVVVKLEKHAYNPAVPLSNLTNKANSLGQQYTTTTSTGPYNENVNSGFRKVAKSAGQCK